MSTTQAEPVVRTEVRDGVLHVVLSRPPANALGLPILEGLAAAAEELETGPARAAVISSALPGFFVAGADIKHMVALDREGMAAYRDTLRAPIERLAASGFPVIAAIDGLALGGGLELAMACTLRYATPASQLGLPEVKLGLIPGAGGTQRLGRLVGRGRALDILLSARQVPGEEALAIGLVDELVDGDVVAAAHAFAATLARSSAEAVRSIIRCVDASELTPAEGMAIEGEAIVRTFVDGDGREGLTAFIEKRRPNFA